MTIVLTNVCAGADLKYFPWQGLPWRVWRSICSACKTWCGSRLVTKASILCGLESHTSLTAVNVPACLQDMSFELLGLTVLGMCLHVRDILINQSHCRLWNSRSLWTHTQDTLCSRLSSSRRNRQPWQITKRPWPIERMSMTRQDRDPCPLRVDPQPRADKTRDAHRSEVGDLVLH